MNVDIKYTFRSLIRLLLLVVVGVTCITAVSLVGSWVGLSILLNVWIE